MELTFLFSLFLGILAFAYLVKRHLHKDLKLPPGLPWVPFLGSIPFMNMAGKNRPQYFMELSQKYGSIFSFWLGNSYTVVLNDYDSIREALVHKAPVFAGRPFPQQPVRCMINPHMKGIIDPNYTAEWKKDRNTSLAILRKFGFGRTVMQEKILQEVEALISVWGDLKGQPIDPCDVVTTAVGNVICSMSSGKRFSHGDCREFMEAIEAIDHTSITMSKLYMFQFLPFKSLHRFLPSFGTRAKALTDTNDTLLRFVQHLTEGQPRDADTFVKSYRCKFGEDLNEENVLFITRDLLIAGTETTKTVLMWCFVYMANNPSVQIKVQQELDRVLGDAPQVTMEDKSILPFTEAVVLEIQRLAVLAPLAVPHLTLEDTCLAGYDIPANTTVFINLWSVLRDPKLWPDPAAFKPERFLDEDGQMVYRPELIPFSLGKRKCLGEMLARQEVFLFFSEILRNFTIRLPPGVERLDEEGNTFTTRMPLPFKLVIEKRNRGVPKTAPA